MEEVPLKKKSQRCQSPLYGNLVFVVLELVMAIYTSSQAVLLDAVYDGIEFFMLLPSIFLIPLLYQPSNEKHPFGYMQVETIFVVVKGITMTAVTIGLIANNINLLLHGGRAVSFHTVAYSRALCLHTWNCSHHLSLAEKPPAASPLIATEMEGWKIDSMISLGMTAAFLLPSCIPFAWFQPAIPYLDQGNHHCALHDYASGSGQNCPRRDPEYHLVIPPEEETIQEIKQTVEPIISVYDYSEIYYDIVRTGRKLWISTYITLEKDEISLSEFKIAQARCIDALAKKYTDFYFELLPDIEFNGKERRRG